MDDGGKAKMNKKKAKGAKQTKNRDSVSNLCGLEAEWTDYIAWTRRQPGPPVNLDVLGSITSRYHAGSRRR